MDLLVMMEHAHLFVQSCGRSNGDLQMNGQWGNVVSCWSLKVDSKSNRADRLVNHGNVNTQRVSPVSQSS